MEIQVTQEQGRVPVTVLHVFGDVDASTGSVLEERAQRAIQEGARDMVIDLAHVPYMSSYGIRVLSQIFTWLRGPEESEDDAHLSKGLRDGSYHAGHLKLAKPSDRVMLVLKTTGMDMLLEIHEDVKKAVGAF